MRYKDKEDAVIEITLPKDNHQIFATQYQFYLPSNPEHPTNPSLDNRIYFRHQSRRFRKRDNDFLNA